MSRVFRLGSLLVLPALVACAGPLPRWEDLPQEEDDALSVPGEAYPDVEPVPILLRHAWHPGQTVTWAVWRDVVVEGQDGGGAGEPARLLRSSSRLRYSCQVLAVDDWGAARLLLTCTAVRLRVQRGEEVHLLDTEESLRSGVLEVDAWARLIGQPLRLEVDHRGRILALEGADGLRARLGEGLPAERRFSALEDAEDRLTPAALQRDLQALFPLYPDGRLMPDQAWEDLAPVGNPRLEGGALARLTWTYLGLVDRPEGRCARLRVRWGFTGREQERGGERLQIPPHALQGVVYARYQDGRLVGSEPLELEREVVRTPTEGPDQRPRVWRQREALSFQLVAEEQPEAQRR